MFPNSGKSPLARPSIERRSQQPSASSSTGPQFAIVRVPQSSAHNALRLYDLLLNHGYSEVSFVNEIRPHSFLPHQHTSNNGGGGVSRPTNGPNFNGRSPMQTSAVEAEMAMGMHDVSVNPSQMPPSPLGQDEPSGFEEEYVDQGSELHYFQPGSGSGVRPMRGLRPALGTSAAGMDDDEDETVVTESGRTETYSKCQLCKNKIMSTRLSNLINHVKRHATMKQYQCPHCQYGHNEQAKVRLHMTHNHNDYTTKVVDALTPDMQMQWAVLMEQCFAKHARRFGPAAAMAAASGKEYVEPSNPSTPQGMASTSSTNRCPLVKNVDADATYTCVACGEMVVGGKLLDHLAEAHRKDCRPYTCAECGYQNITQWKVRLHINAKHPEKINEVAVEHQSSSGANYALFVERFFPEIPVDDEDEDEGMVGEELQKITSGDGNKAEKPIPSPKEVTVKIEPQPAVVVVSQIKAESAENGAVTAKCEMCGGRASPDPVTNLLQHAKRHYIVKQYRCPECSHSATERASVEAHMADKHPDSIQPLVDQLTAELKAAWVETGKKCFPKFHSRIEQWWLREWRAAKEMGGGREPTESPFKAMEQSAEAMVSSLRESEFQLPFGPAPPAMDRSSSAGSTISSTSANEAKRRRLSVESSSESTSMLVGSRGPGAGATISMVTRSSSRAQRESSHVSSEASSSRG